MEVTFVKGKVNECCEKAENLEKQDSDRDDLIIEKCRICGRLHRTFKCDPGKMGLIMK